MFFGMKRLFKITDRRNQSLCSFLVLKLHVIVSERSVRDRGTDTDSVTNIQKQEG